MLRVLVYEDRTHTVVGVTILFQIRHNNYNTVRQTDRDIKIKTLKQLQNQFNILLSL